MIDICLFAVYLPLKVDSPLQHDRHLRLIGVQLFHAPIELVIGARRACQTRVKRRRQVLLELLLLSFLLEQLGDLIKQICAARDRGTVWITLHLRHYFLY